MGSSKRNLLTSILLLVVMGVFAVLTIFIVVDAINKKYYNDIKVEYEVQEESPNIILTFARNEGSNFGTDDTKVVLSEDNKKFRIDGTVPTIESGVVTNLDDLTSSDGREFYFFSTNSSFIDPQEDPENPDFIFSDTDFRYYVSTESDPIWYEVPKSSENLTLYSVFLTPNVHNSDFANAPLLNTSPNVIISHDVVDIPYNAFSDIMAYGQSQGQTGVAKIESVVIPNSTKSIDSCLEINYLTGETIIGGAFAACTTLTDIIIPGSVEEIGGDAFMLCSGLDTVEYGNGYYLPTESNEHAILIDTNLKAEDVTIHADCISIQGGAFSKFFFVELGFIPPPDMGDGSNIEEILRDYINMNLQKITIPKNVKNIGFSAFAMCMGLENVVFEENSDLTSIGAISFGGCSSLKTINLEATKLEEIGLMAFSSDGLMPILIEEITLPSTLKTIGEGAFGYCGSLKTVNFENNSQLMSIGSSAFEYCESLTSITIPDSVTSIGNSAFEDCSSLETVTFGENSQLTSIGSSAFSYCSSLTSIKIPSSVTSIGSYAFRYCYKLVEVYDLTGSEGLNVTAGSRDNGYVGYYADYVYTDTNTPLVQKEVNNDYIFYYNNGVMYLLSYTGNDKELKLPSIVKVKEEFTDYKGDTYEIYEYAFYKNTNVTSVVIPEGVTSIGDSAFYNCSSLTSITIPNSVTSIGGEAFYNCSSLTSIKIPDSVTSIGDNAFRNCIGLTSITFEDMTGLTNIGTYTFDGCDNVKQLTIQSGEVKDLDFSDLSNLTTVTLGDSVTSIGEGVFEDFSSLETVTFGETSQLTSIGSYAFYNCRSLTSITIPDSVTSIGNYAFFNCSSLETVNFGENSILTSIGERTFYSCSSLTSITIPESVTGIENYAFYDCSSLETVTFGETSQLTSIGGEAFYNCRSLTSITIPDSVTSIGNSAFSYCSSLETVNFGENSQLTSIGRHAFSRCSSLNSITIPESVTSIGERAFYNCSSLTSITIPSSVKSIGERAFEDCSSLETVTFGENSQLTSIGSSAFSGCSSLSSITIPESVTSIGSYAFLNCSNIQELRIDDLTSYLNISYGSYSSPLYDTDQAVSLYVGGELITNLEIPDGVTAIPNSAFRSVNITSVTIPSSVTSIEYSAFEDCSSLTSITIPDSVTSIGSGAFEDCSSLTSIIIPDSVTSIGSAAFYNCSSLTIYCEVEIQPSGWISSWNYSNRPVYWAGGWEMVDGVPVPKE